DQKQDDQAAPAGRPRDQAGEDGVGDGAGQDRQKTNPQRKLRWARGAAKKLTLAAYERPVGNAGTVSLANLAVGSDCDSVATAQDVARMQRCSSTTGLRAWQSFLIGPEPPDHIQPKVADFLAQGITVKTQQLGGADLIATRRRQADGDQGPLHVHQDTVINAGRRQLIALLTEIAVEEFLHRGRE